MMAHGRARHAGGLLHRGAQRLGERRATVEADRGAHQRDGLRAGIAQLARAVEHRVDDRREAGGRHGADAQAACDELDPPAVQVGAVLRHQPVRRRNDEADARRLIPASPSAA
jgi:hypothetical protein